MKISIFFRNSVFFFPRGIAEFEIFVYVFLMTAFVKFICVYLNRIFSIGDSVLISVDIIKAFIDMWVLLICMLLRTSNVILPSSLLLNSHIVSKILRKQPNEITKLIIVHHWLARVYFFYQVVLMFGNFDRFRNEQIYINFLFVTGKF